MAGSLGYAERLKNKRRLGGQLGATEFSESVDTVEEKVQQLATLMSSGKPVFLFTGAGISTSVGIPDFRGPTGIWTLKKKKQPITAPLTPFEHAKPSFTHMVCAALIASGKANMICSQNVDSLHLRSGVPRNRLAELHGNCFAERCPVCKTEYVRDFQVETLDFKPTGRLCVQPGCSGALIDNVLDWDSSLPDDELDASIEAAGEAGVCLVLGSSLQISPANEIPLVTVDNKGKLAIINLQKTPRDRRAKVIVRAKVDPVMALLSKKLDLTVSPYLRMDGVVVCHKVITASGCKVKAESSGSKATLDNPDQKVQTGVLNDGNASSAPVSGGDHALQPEQPEQSVIGEVSVGPVKSDSKADDAVEEHRKCHSVQLMVRSVHGQTCILPMVQSITLTVDTDENHSGDMGSMTVSVLDIGQSAPSQVPREQPQTTDQAPDQDQQLEQPIPSGGTNADAEGGQRVQGTAQQPFSVIAHAPAVSGGVPLGGSYEFLISNIPAGAPTIRCHLKLHLVQWADGDKQVVELQPYVINLAHASEYPSNQDVASIIRPTGLTLPCQAPSQTLRMLGFPQPSAAPVVDSTSSSNGIKQELRVGPQNSTDATSNDQLPAQLHPSLGPLPTVQVTSSQAALYTFFTQERRYDPAAVWDAFKADPPPVLLPQPRAAKKPKTTGSMQHLRPSQIADLRAAAAGVTLRRSGRRGSASAPNLTEEVIRSDDLQDGQEEESDNEQTDDN